MYQDMTTKYQSVHLFTRTHDVVDARKVPRDAKNVQRY